jgi:hypothetical protein
VDIAGNSTAPGGDSSSQYPGYQFGVFGNLLITRRTTSKPMVKSIGIWADVESVEAPNVPTQAGPVPDRMTIWPMEDGSYGLDATFQGASGYERAERHTAGLQAGTVRHSFRQELGGAWTIRFGPLSAAEISVALTAFVR